MKFDASAVGLPAPLTLAGSNLVEWVSQVSGCRECTVGLVTGLLFVIVPPFTHLHGGRFLHTKQHFNTTNTYFAGGARFVLLQALSWTFWGVAVLSLVAAAWAIMRATELPTPVLAGASVCGAVLSEVLMVSSLLFFQEHLDGATPEIDVSGGCLPGLKMDAKDITAGTFLISGRQQSQAVGAGDDAVDAVFVPTLQLGKRVDGLRGTYGAGIIAVLCAVLSLTGHGLVASVASGHVVGPSRMLFLGISAICIICSTPLTHGLAGRLRHTGKPGSWRFVNPGRGGWTFVALQGAGWALYGVSLAAFLGAFWLLLEAVSGGHVTALWQLLEGATGHAFSTSRALPAAVWVAGTSGVASQVLLALSLPAFRPAGAPRAAAAAELSVAAPREALDVWTLVSLVLVYAPCHVLTIGLASVFVALPPARAVALLAAVGACYGVTFVGGPSHTGARTWLAFQRHCADVLSVSLCKWFGSVCVVREAPEAPLPSERLVFGYHPHGMYPAAAAWFHHTPQWRALFPGTRPVTMGASAIFMTPILRDVVMWSGARCVSRRAVARALGEGTSIVLCPGGQAELVEHASGPDTVLYTRHKGFVRMSLEAGASLCPVFVFGEAHAQRNVLRWQALQRWTCKRLGFPFPFLPGGYLKVLPLPEPAPLTFVVGAPIAPPPRAAGSPVTDAEVDAMHARYYEALVALFAKHKDAAGYQNARLVLK